MPFAVPWEGPETVILSEVNQIDQDKYVWRCLNVESTKKKKNRTNEFIYKTEVDSQMQKTTLWFSSVQFSPSVVSP